MLSNIKSVICSKECASVSNITVPFKTRLRNSNSECNDNVATCGLDHRLPPSSTSSSNFIHLFREKKSKSAINFYEKYTFIIKFKFKIIYLLAKFNNRIHENHLAVSFHSSSCSLRTNSSISVNRG